MPATQHHSKEPLLNSRRRRRRKNSTTSRPSWSWLTRKSQCRECQPRSYGDTKQILTDTQVQNWRRLLPHYPGAGPGTAWPLNVEARGGDRGTRGQAGQHPGRNDAPQGGPVCKIWENHQSRNMTAHTLRCCPRSLVFTSSAQPACVRTSSTNVLESSPEKPRMVGRHNGLLVAVSSPRAGSHDDGRC